MITNGLTRNGKSRYIHRNWDSQQLYEVDPVTGDLRPIEGDGPFWNGRGQYWGHDWLWRDADGRYLLIQTESIFYITFLVC